jgi:chaperonin GroES
MNDTWRIKPSLGNVLVKPQKEELVTPTGLVMVSFVEKETHICEVVEVCDPYEAVATDRSIQRGGPIYPLGTLVIIGKYNGREIKLDREKFILIRESDVLGTLEERVQPCDAQCYVPRLDKTSRCELPLGHFGPHKSGDDKW